MIENLKAIRESLGLTRGKFSLLLGLSYPCVYNWEARKHAPSSMSQERIAETLNKIQKEFRRTKPKV